MLSKASTGLGVGAVVLYASPPPPLQWLCTYCTYVTFKEGERGKTSRSRFGSEAGFTAEPLVFHVVDSPSPPPPLTD